MKPKYSGAHPLGPRELGEVRKELAVKDEALHVIVQAFRINRQQLEHSTTEAEQLRDSLQDLQEDLHRVEERPGCLGTSQEKQHDGAMSARPLYDRLTDHIQQSRRLAIRLQRAGEGVSDALGRVVGFARKRKREEEPPSAEIVEPAMKRMRIKLEDCEVGPPG